MFNASLLLALTGHCWTRNGSSRVKLYCISFLYLDCISLESSGCLYSMKTKLHNILILRFKDWSILGFKIINVFFNPLDLNWSISSQITDFICEHFNGGNTKNLPRIYKNISPLKFFIKSYRRIINLHEIYFFLSLFLNKLSYRALLRLKMKIHSITNW